MSVHGPAGSAHSPVSSDTAAGASLRALFTSRRVRLAGAALSAQAVVQAMGLLAGILLVRMMDPAQFALFTLASSVLVTAALLADLGLASGVLAEGGRQPDASGPAWARVCADARRLQWWLAGAMLLLALPAGLVVFTHHGAGGGVAWALVALALATAMLQARNGLALSVVRLAGDVAWQQRVDLALGAARLAAVALALTLWLDIGAVMALSLQTASALCMALALHQWLRRRHLATLAGQASGGHAPALRRQLVRQGPNGVWYAVSSQLALWLMAALGSAADVAALGALGRLAGVFTVIGVLMAALAQPYFARQQQAAALVTAFAVVNLLFAALLLALLAGAATCPQALLWLLGPAYAGLQTELLWMVAASTLAAWGGALYSLGCARGWVLPLGWAVASSLGATLLAAATLDLATPRGALMMNTQAASLSLLAVLGFMAARLRQHGSGLVAPAATGDLPARTEASAT